MGTVNYFSVLKYNTLLLQNAFEEEEDAPDELAPKGYYDNSKHVCKVVGVVCDRFLEMPSKNEWCEFIALW